MAAIFCYNTIHIRIVAPEATACDINIMKKTL